MGGGGDSSTMVGEDTVIGGGVADHFPVQALCSDHHLGETGLPGSIGLVFCRSEAQYMAGVTGGDVWAAVCRCA